jgi:tripartite-type tricarboxylate transporter receptor subunit TctC
MHKFAAVVVGSAVCLLATASYAQTYPARPARIVVQFAAGGGADFVARVVGTKLSESLGQTFVVDNRAGANGAIANELVAKSPADGYTLLLGAAGPMTIAPAVYKSLPFDSLRDFAPISMVASSSFAVTLHPSVPAGSVKELIALAKRSPGKLTFGSSGTTGSPHLAGELFLNMADIKMVHVPYKGLAPAITELLGGQIDALFADVGLVATHINANKLKGIAVTGAQRSALLPSLPTVSESGLPGYEAGTWYGVLAPSGTPADVVQKLNGEIIRIIALPDVRERFKTQGAESAGTTPAQFREVIRTEIAKWQKLVKAAKIEIQ